MCVLHFGVCPPFFCRFARYLAFDPYNMDLAKTLCGSPVYMAPEILSKHEYGANVDLWSAGAA